MREKHEEKPDLEAQVSYLWEIEKTRRSLYSKLNPAASVPDAFRYEETSLKLRDHQTGKRRLNSLCFYGLNVQRWALENPHILTKVAIVALGIVSAYLAYNEIQATITAASVIPEKTRELIEATFSYNPRLIDAGAATPSIRITPGEGLLPVPKIEVGTPDFSAAFEPMYEAQRKTYETARTVLNQQITSAVNHGVAAFKWTLLSLAGITSPLTHPWERLVKQPADLFIGRPLDLLGRVIK